MNKLFALIFLFFTISSQSQSNNIVKETFDKLKQKTKVDKKDTICFHLMQNLYDDVLQNEKSEIQEITIKKIKEYQENKKSKNLHLFFAFLFYQDCVTKSTESKVVKPELQRDIINYLESEYLEIYNKIPKIIYVYKVETLNLFENKTEIKKYIDEGLKYYPESIPLKYYSYTILGEQTYKDELLKINKKHWLVNL